MLWTIAAALVAISAFFYILFVRERDIPEPVPVSPIQHLEDRKQAIYENLRDLQFEYRLGKLSDEDYRQTKQALQRELAVVLAETEGTLNRLGLTSKPQVKPVSKPSGTVCPHCNASFPQALKFCGECGKAIA
jgi:rRNA maturation endonuclease Nob1